MKMMKIALLATAAVAAVSVSARADELSDLKAQIEALNNRMAVMETAPAVPAGYQLLSIGKGQASVVPGLEADKDYGDTATVISILPTADAPASTVVEITGFARAALVVRNDNWDPVVLADLDGDGLVDDYVSGGGDEEVGVRSRGQVKISGKTDTAIGEIGALMVLRANAGTGKAPGDVTSPEYWGYWAMTPELTLGGGYTGSLSGIGYGYDGKCNCYYTDNANAGYGHGDASQIRLSYASGPIGFAIALEDDGTDNLADDDGALGVAAEVKYAGDMISGEVSAGWWNNDGAGPDDAWQVAAGLGFNLDMFSISMSAGAFHGHADVDYWKANILASVNMSDTIHAELGFNQVSSSDIADESAVLAGIYYDPVSQLTIGLEAEWINPEGGSNDRTQVDLVTVYRF